jgi:hypothetical protein
MCDIIPIHVFYTSSFIDLNLFLFLFCFHLLCASSLYCPSSSCFLHFSITYFFSFLTQISCIILNNISTLYSTSFFLDFFYYFSFFQVTATQLVDEIIFIKMGGKRDGVKSGDLGSNSGIRSLGSGTFPSFIPDENRNQNHNQNPYQAQNHGLGHNRGYQYHSTQDPMHTTRINAMHTVVAGNGNGNGIGGNIGNSGGGGGAVRSIDGTCPAVLTVRTASHGKGILLYL